MDNNSGFKRKFPIGDRIMASSEERIKILDTVDDAEEIKVLVGNVSSVPLWYDPISGFQSPGLKTMAEIKNMGIILE